MTHAASFLFLSTYHNRMNRVTVGRENEVDRDAARPYMQLRYRNARAAVCCCMPLRCSTVVTR